MSAKDGKRPYVIQHLNEKLMDDIKDFNPVYARNVKIALVTRSFKIILTERLSNVGGLKGKDDHEKRRARSAAKLAELVINERFSGRTLDATKVENASKGTYVSGAGGQPDEVETKIELFLGPGVTPNGLNTAQWNNKCKQGYSTYEEANVELVEALGEILSHFTHTVISELYQHDHSDNGVNLLNRIISTFASNVRGDLRLILLSAFNEYKFKGPHEFEKYWSTKINFFDLMSEDAKKAIDIDYKNLNTRILLARALLNPIASINHGSLMAREADRLIQENATLDYARNIMMSAALVDCKEFLTKKVEKSFKIAYTSKNKGKRNRSGTQKMQCSICREEGHWKSNCPCLTKEGQSLVQKKYEEYVASKKARKDDA